MIWNEYFIRLFQTELFLVVLLSMYSISRLIFGNGESILLIKTITVDLISREISFSVNYSTIKDLEISWKIFSFFCQYDIVLQHQWSFFLSLSTFFEYCLCYSFDEANYFSSINIKRTFLLFLVGILETEYLVCVHASIVNYFTRTHILIERRRKKGNDLCWSTHHWKKKTM